MEIWKSIPNVSGYEASNLGNIRSIDRSIKTSNNQIRKYKGRILKPNINKTGRKYVVVSKNRTTEVHIFVFEAFKGKRTKGMVIDHKDNNVLNNNENNLQEITYNENCTKDNGKKVHGIKFNRSNRYEVCFIKNNKSYFIGTFKTIEEAKFAYNETINDLSSVNKYRKRKNYVNRKKENIRVKSC